jgi:hypothetical protein
MSESSTIGWVTEYLLRQIRLRWEEHGEMTLDQFAAAGGLFTGAEVRSMYWSELAQVAALYDRELDFRTYARGQS